MFEEKIITQVVEDIKSGNYKQARLVTRDGEKQVKFSFTNGIYAALSQDGTLWISILQPCEDITFEEAVNMADADELERLKRKQEETEEKIKILTAKYSH